MQRLANACYRQLRHLRVAMLGPQHIRMQASPGDGALAALRLRSVLLDFPL
jgi:hypothetical protein